MFRCYFVATDNASAHIQEDFGVVGYIVYNRDDDRNILMVPAPEYPPLDTILSPETEQRASAAFDALRHALES